MDIEALIQTRRSIRSFLPQSVEDDVLRSLILKAGIWAPSAGNSQTWKFFIVTDPVLLQKIKLVSPGLPNSSPSLIIVCQNLLESEEKGGKLGPQFLAIADAAMAAQNIMLYAHSLSLGTCVVASFHKEALKTLLKLPEGFFPIFIIAVGYPSFVPKAPSRKKDVIWFNEYK